MRVFSDFPSLNLCRITLKNIAHSFNYALYFCIYCINRSLRELHLHGVLAPLRRIRAPKPIMHKSQRFCHLHGLFSPPCRRFSATLPEHLATKSSASASTGRADINFLILGYAPHSCNVSSQHAKRNNNPRISVFAATFLRRSL